MTNLERLIKQLGLQGGTIHQVSNKTGIRVDYILSMGFVKCPNWAKDISYPKMVSPCGDYVESLKAYPLLVEAYIQEGWKFCK